MLKKLKSIWPRYPRWPSWRGLRRNSGDDLQGNESNKSPATDRAGSVPTENQTGG